MANATIAYFITNEQKKTLSRYQLIADAIVEQIYDGNKVSEEAVKMYLEARLSLCEFFGELEFHNKLAPSTPEDEEAQLQFCKNIEKKLNPILTEQEQRDSFY